MIYVLHHMDSDGRFGGYAAWRYLVLQFSSKELVKEKVRFIEVQYGQKFPIEFDQLTKEDVIYIIDFSYDRVILDQVYELVGGSLTVLDHHRSAELQLAGTPYGHFDKTKSGALIAWNYFFPTTSAPYACVLVNDYDLWLKEHEPNTAAFEAWLNFEKVGQDWEQWQRLSFDMHYLFKALEKGKVLHAQNMSIVDAFVKNRGNYVIGTNTGLKYTYAVYNGNTILRNEIAEALYTKYKLDLTIQWRVRGEEFLFSVRATNPEKISADEFCAQFGKGGGNPKAGGFALPLDEGFALIKSLMGK
jgi:oligoribonuclease NrnB/cAMP/cGMP phosphodiesterase (DHH superfamily)